MIEGDAVGARARVTLTTESRVAQGLTRPGGGDLVLVGGVWHDCQGGGATGEGGQRR